MSDSPAKINIRVSTAWEEEEPLHRLPHPIGGGGVKQKASTK